MLPCSPCESPNAHIMSLDAELYPELAQLIADIEQRPRGVTFGQLAKDCNLTERWISDFMRGIITEPGYKKITRLRNRITEIKESQSAE